jgi:hypothetical protein
MAWSKMKLEHHRDDKGRIFRMWGPFQFGRNEETGEWLVLNGKGKVLTAPTLDEAKSRLTELVDTTDFVKLVEGYTQNETDS